MTTIKEAITLRHSVRQYQDKPIEEDVVKRLKEEIEVCNKEGGLHLQLVVNEPHCFDCILAKFGRFSGVTNYIALIAKSGADEAVGYYGEKLVLLAQTLGLNSCWVAGTYSYQRDYYTQEADEVQYGVIALGYGVTQGVQHSMRPMEQFVQASIPLPDWFKNGMEAALLAPTAVHQQRFFFELVDENTVRATTRFSLFGKTVLDLGIVKYHFEVGAGKENFKWA